MRMTLIGIVALALVGCSQAASQQNSAANMTAAESTTNHQQELIAQPDAARNAVLFRAIRDAGLPCQQVLSSERVPDQQAAPAWRATCEDNSSHMISVQADGIAHVISPRG